MNTPIELLKCKAQVNRLENLKYSTVYKQVGIQGLYKGFWPLFWRDMPSWGVYFGSYEFLKLNFV